jgi:ethanolaminephosphotransferase
MSGVASNYDVFLLSLGQGIAAMSLGLATSAIWKSGVKLTTPLAVFLSISLLYAAMTFASSYVEEEQHFWYWTTAAWLSLLWVKGSV